ncbi:MAG: hypothetical protein A3F72_20975 [Bacteroidetes bacterium RIFCSPLOWO2_12_FULL_35_15]|nr:MAG: hypothetical protein A3F72_20975 [Bacteroidetes bacterium RIFCSPLOWO2_12_FULL_35_15]
MKKSIFWNAQKITFVITKFHLENLILVLALSDKKFIINLKFNLDMLLNPFFYPILYGMLYN